MDFDADLDTQWVDLQEQIISFLRFPRLLIFLVAIVIASSSLNLWQQVFFLNFGTKSCLSSIAPLIDHC